MIDLKLELSFDICNGVKPSDMLNFDMPACLLMLRILHFVL